MKNRIIIIYLMAIISFSGFSQVPSKSSFMVMPSTSWMKANNYMTEVDNQGETVYIYDYKRAVTQDVNLGDAISTIEGVLKRRGLTTKVMKTYLANIDAQRAQNAMATSKTSKSGIAESALEKLKKIAKADYIIYLGWTQHSSGPNKKLTFKLEGVDAYTDELAGEAGGTGAASFDMVLPEMLEEAVNTHIDQFLADISTHADDIFANGRKVKLLIQKWSSWNGDLEKVYNSKELRDIIEDWMKENAVNGSYMLEDSSENLMLFNNVRIPILDANGKGQTADNFFKPLWNMLEAPPYSIATKRNVLGLGKVEFTLGEK